MKKINALEYSYLVHCAQWKVKKDVAIESILAYLFTVFTL